MRDEKRKSAGGLTPALAKRRIRSMEAHMDDKIECDLPACKRKFKPRAVQQRFCCEKHRNQYHQQERLMLVRMGRAMGIMR